MSRRTRLVQSRWATSNTSAAKTSRTRVCKVTGQRPRNTPRTRERSTHHTRKCAPATRKIENEGDKRRHPTTKLLWLRHRHRRRQAKGALLRCHGNSHRRRRHHRVQELLQVKGALLRDPAEDPPGDPSAPAEGRGDRLSPNRSSKTPTRMCLKRETPSTKYITGNVRSAWSAECKRAVLVTHSSGNMVMGWVPSDTP